jgi:anthranilate phosphoribosyltransferase
VLRGDDGLDEITTAGPTRVLEVREGHPIQPLTLTPADFGVKEGPIESARAETVEENAATVRAVLAGQRRDAARELVVLNAAAALHVRTGDGFLDCAARAQHVIDEGTALAKLEAFIALSQDSSQHPSQSSADAAGTEAS